MHRGAHLSATAPTGDNPSARKIAITINLGTFISVSFLIGLYRTGLQVAWPHFDHVEFRLHLLNQNSISMSASQVEPDADLHQ